MAKIGDTFKLANPSIDDHLHIIISDPAQNPNQIVTANFTKWRDDKDQSCIVEIGEHRFIKVRTCVYYGEDRLITLVQYEGFLRSGDLVSDEPIRGDLLKRIIYGAGISPYISFGSRQILVDQGLIDTE